MHLKTLGRQISLNLSSLQKCPEVMSLLEQVNKALDAFFQSYQEVRSEAVFNSRGTKKQYIFMILPQGYVNSPTLCYYTVWRGLDHLDILYNIILVSYIHDIMLIGYDGDNMASWGGISNCEDSRAPCLNEILRA